MGNNLSKSEAEIKITDFLKKQFSEIISEDAKDSGEKIILVEKLRYHIGTEIDILKEVQTLGDYYASCFFESLCDYLQKENLADTIKYSKFNLRDKEFLEFLNGQDVDLVIGPKYALQHMLRENVVFIEELANEKTCVFVDCWNNSMLLSKEKMVKLYFNKTKISGSSHPGELNITFTACIKSAVDQNGTKAMLLVDDFNVPPVIASI